MKELVERDLAKFERDIKNINHNIDILEQKFKSKWFPKKKGGEEDEVREIDKPQDLRSRVLLPE